MDATRSFITWLDHRIQLVSAAQRTRFLNGLTRQILEHKPKLVVVLTDIPLGSSQDLLKPVKKKIGATITVSILSVNELDTEEKLGWYRFFAVNINRLLALPGKEYPRTMTFHCHSGEVGVNTHQFSDFVSPAPQYPIWWNISGMFNVYSYYFPHVHDPDVHPAFDIILHKSTTMTSLIKKANRYAPSNKPVLILGPSGTGKELFARAIHGASPRGGEPFIAINCSAIPKELFDSEVFGAKKGAASYMEKVIGVVTHADKGTLFLDEIGEMSFSHQAKILRFIENNGEYRPLGDTVKHADVRIIAATNRDLINEVKEGRFREDLFYRLNVLALRVPRLEDRLEDKDFLIRHFVSQEGKTISDEAIRRLTDHYYHGNVRELLHVIGRASVLAVGYELTPDVIEESLEGLEYSPREDLLGRPLREGFDMEDLIVELKEHYLLRAHRAAGGNMAEAARSLNMKETTFRRWWDEYGLYDQDL